MAVVHLVRHGSHAELGAVLSGRSDIVLSAAGVAEAERVAARLAALPIDGVYSSPCKRARQTAEVIAARVGLPVAVEDALDEIDFGTWRGRSFVELEEDAAWRRWNAARGTGQAPGGETMAGASARAVAFVERIASAAERGMVVMASHCDVIRGIVAHYLGLSLDRLLAFDVDPGSISSLSVGPWGGRVLGVNERPA